MNHYQSIVCFWIIFAFVFCLCFSVVYTYLPRIETKPYTYAEFSFENEVNKYLPERKISQIDSVNLILSICSFPIILEFDDLGNSCDGKSNMFTHKIILDENLTGWRTLEVLTHELLHVSRKTHDEKYIKFLTFKVLYESNIDILILKAKDMAYNICTKGVDKNTKYDCSWYIANYYGCKTV